MISSLFIRYQVPDSLHCALQISAYAYGVYKAAQDEASKYDVIDFPGNESAFQEGKQTSYYVTASGCKKTYYEVLMSADCMHFKCLSGADGSHGGEREACMAEKLPCVHVLAVASMGRFLPISRQLFSNDRLLEAWFPPMYHLKNLRDAYPAGPSICVVQKDPLELKQLSPPSSATTAGKHARFRDGIDVANGTNKGAPAKKKRRTKSGATPVAPVAPQPSHVTVSISPSKIQRYGTPLLMNAHTEQLEDSFNSDDPEENQGPGDEQYVTPLFAFSRDGSDSEEEQSKASPTPPSNADTDTF